MRLFEFYRVYLKMKRGGVNPPPENLKDRRSQQMRRDKSKAGSKRKGEARIKHRKKQKACLNPKIEPLSKHAWTETW